MQRKLLASAAVLAAALMAVPAQAATQIGSYDARGVDISWTGGGTSGTLTGSGTVQFTFDAGPLDNDIFQAEMILSGNTTKKAVTEGGLLDYQTVMSGSIEYLYTGPTENVDGVQLTQGKTILLEGTYTGADIVGSVGTKQGFFSDETGPSSTVTYSHALTIDLSGVKSSSFDYTFNNANKTFGTLPGTHTLPSFQSDSTGSFAVDNVPEPATWATMIFGLCAVGFMIRASRRGSLDFGSQA